MRPGSLNNVLGPLTLKHNLIRQPASLRHNKKIERIAKMLMVHNRVVLRILTFEGHLPAGLHPEQDRHHRESLLVVRRDLTVRFGTVAFRVPELDVGLVGGEADGVAPLATGGVSP